jgi:hypothetical protein
MSKMEKKIPSAPQPFIHFLLQAGLILWSLIFIYRDGIRTPLPILVGCCAAVFSMALRQSRRSHNLSFASILLEYIVATFVVVQELP